MKRFIPLYLLATATVTPAFAEEKIEETTEEQQEIKLFQEDMADYETVKEARLEGVVDNYLSGKGLPTMDEIEQMQVQEANYELKMNEASKREQDMMSMVRDLEEEVRQLENTSFKDYRVILSVDGGALINVAELPEGNAVILPIAGFGLGMTNGVYVDATTIFNSEASDERYGFGGMILGMGILGDNMNGGFIFGAGPVGIASNIKLEDRALHGYGAGISFRQLAFPRNGPFGIQFQESFMLTGNYQFNEGNDYDPKEKDLGAALVFEAGPVFRRPKK
ncbi:MAG: hypothetical protein ABIJ18_05610 [archaeon]